MIILRIGDLNIRYCQLPFQIHNYLIHICIYTRLRDTKMLREALQEVVRRHHDFYMHPDAFVGCSINITHLGCRYNSDIMHEIHDVCKMYTPQFPILGSVVQRILEKHDPSHIRRVPERQNVLLEGFRGHFNHPGPPMLQPVPHHFSRHRGRQFKRGHRSNQNHHRHKKQKRTHSYYSHDRYH